MSSSPFDAFLLVSFGGPEGPDEVMPFLERVTAGRGVPPERLALVARHYLARGGVSPINGQCRDLLKRLAVAFEEAGIDLPLYWGNRNAAPFLGDTVADMAADGVTHALALVTSAFSSYSGCRQYRENVADACASVGGSAPQIDKLRVYFNHPGFIEPLVDGLAEAMRGLDPSRTQVFFTAHSIPSASAATSDYEAQVHNAAALVAGGVSPVAQWSVAWQSRSGPPTVPWLGPDIVEAIESLDPQTVSHVVVVPVGFVSDHMEVIQDLDTDAAATAARLGFGFSRVPTSGTDDRFVAMIVDLVKERIEGATPVALGELGLVPTQCGERCCPAPARRPVSP